MTFYADLGFFLAPICQYLGYRSAIGPHFESDICLKSILRPEMCHLDVHWFSIVCLFSLLSPFNF